jgi:hypothetical protein
METMKVSTATTRRHALRFAALPVALAACAGPGQSAGG